MLCVCLVSSNDATDPERGERETETEIERQTDTDKQIETQRHKETERTIVFFATDLT